jgi:hypothetical protein
LTARVQRPEAGGGLFGGKVRDEVGHAVGGQPDPHVPARPGGAGPGLGLVGGDLHGQAGGQVVDPPYPEPLDPLGREPLVHRGPLGPVEVRGRCDDLLDLVLGQLPGGEQPAQKSRKSRRPRSRWQVLFVATDRRGLA